MPDPNTQRYIGLVATVGVLTSCFGCALMARNEVSASLAFLILAQLILLPTFVYLLRTRRSLKRVARTREARRKEELDALAGVGGLLAGEEKKENADLR